MASGVELLFFFFKFFYCCAGWRVHCDIYKSSHNASNVCAYLLLTSFSGERSLRVFCSFSNWIAWFSFC
jgi:hypothetical protein